MDFVDEVKINAKAGKGGNGSCSFRKEKFIEFGGPDGGDGGKGGSIRLVASNNVNTLLRLKNYPHIKAKNGKGGRGCNKTGESGEDAIVPVPVGTQVFDVFGNLLFDLSSLNDEVILAKGGMGGVGNLRFKSSTNRAPRHFTYGEEGESGDFFLKLKLIADVGIIGLPNIGKSTFLACSSAAMPKIADYPFTTLHPNLGVVLVGYNDFVLADIPGIIEGAHMGLGLGHKFLKHVERCKILLHMVDATSDDLSAVYKSTRYELEEYNIDIAHKDEIVVLSKCDLLSPEEIIEKKILMEVITNNRVYTVAHDKRAVELLNFISEFLMQSKEKEPAFDPYYAIKKKV